MGVFGFVILLAVTAGPGLDGDGDGVLDRDDRCPADAETHNGYQDTDGCPDIAPAGSEAGKIVERIAFAHDSSDLRPVSAALLDAIAIVIRNQPQLFPVVALEGHAADNERSPMKLSLARASAVRLALIARGVDAGRLLARASGTTAPVCTQVNEGCWARERTVEFVALATPKPAPAPPVAEVERPNTNGEPAAARPASDAAAAAIPLERIEFKKGSAVIGPAALANLDIVAGFMKATPAPLEILGYAAGDERRGPTLARARADAVRAYMLACGVSAQHLTVRAAESAPPPRCRSRDEACHTRNRRAELRFIESQAPARAAGDGAAAAPPND